MADTRPSLNVLSGPLAGQRFVIEDAVDNILIGSDPSCGIHLDSPGVSPIHARLWIDLEGAKVYDTNSPTGVYVNDDRVVKEAPVRNGDILWLGPPGEEGSVLIQCILPPPRAAAPPPVPMAPTLAETEDTSATVVGVPAYRPDDLEELTPPPPPPRPAAAAPADDIDSTVVMSSGPLVDPTMMDLEGGESPTVAYRPSEGAHDASNLVDDGPLEVVDEPLSPGPPPLPSTPPPIPSYAAAPPPVSSAPASAPAEDMGFPEFEVEPTVVMPPPPAAAPPSSAQEPVRFNVPLATSAPPPAPEFEDELAETVLDVPAPAMPPKPAPPSPKDAHAEEDDTAATVMYHASDVPVRPPPAPPPAPPAPPRAAPAAPPATAAPPAPPRAATAGAAAGASAAAARPAAEAKPPAPPRPAASAPGAAARPAAPAPRPRPERPAAAGASAAAPRGGGGKGAMIAAAAGVVLVLLLAGGYFAMRSKGTTTAEVTPTTEAPAITTPPTTIAAVAPPVTEAVAPPVTEAAAPATVPVPTTLAPVAAPTTLAAARTPPPSPRVAAVPATLPGQRPGTVPGGKPVAPPVTGAPAPNPAQQTAAAVANLLSQAQAASGSKNYDAAVTLYDEVLKLQPGNGPATSGRTAALSAKSAASSARRAFVSGRTVVQAEKAKGGGGVSGFDSSDVSVVKSPDFQGRLEFAMNPPSIKPGESYRLQIALVNEGKKPIKVSGMTFTITANGQKTGNPIAPRVKEVAPGQRAVLEELPGVFPEASTWTAEVLVTANKGDSLKNQLTWK